MTEMLPALAKTTARARRDLPPAERTTPATSSAYYPLFDWLRIALALAVALEHAEVFGWPHAGNLAVQVFFALSGWLIGGILLETKPRDLSRFWFNRATRIWVPYGVTLALILGVGLVRDHVTPTWIRTAFAYATMTYNWFGYAAVEHGDPVLLAMPLRGSGHPLWSIGVEEQFYLFAPLLLVLLPRRIGRSPAVWVVLSAVALVSGYFGAISLGVLAAVLRSRLGAWHERPAGAAAAGAGALAAAAAMALGVRYELVAPVFGIAVVLLLARPGERTRVGAFLGGVSYPLYLNHWIGAFGAHALLRPFGLRDAPIATPVAVVLGLGVATALYLAVDRQVMARRSSWFTPRLGWSLGAVGFGLMAMGVAIGLLAG